MKFSRIFVLLSVLKFTILVKSNQDLCTETETRLGTTFDCSRRGLTTVPQHLPRNVTRLTLRSNSLYSLPNQIFSRYADLIYLDISINDIGQISKETFFNLTNLEELDMHNCLSDDLKVFPLDIFKHTKQLKSLNMACNTIIGFRGVMAALAHAQLSLQYLIIDHVQSDNSPLILDKDMFHGVNFTQLKGVSIRNEHLTVIEVQALKAFQNVEYLVIGFNVPISIKPEPIYRAAEEMLMSFRNIKFLDTSHLYLPLGAWYNRKFCGDHFKSTEEYFSLPDIRVKDESLKIDTSSYNPVGKIKHDRDFLQYPPPNIKYLFISDMKPFKGIHVSNGTVGMNSLQFVNMSHSNVEDSSGPIIGLKYLEIADVSHCGINIIVPGTLDNFPRLRYLFLNDNKLGLGPYKLHKTFTKLWALEHLDLSGNGIKTISSSAFVGLTKLRYISLAGNLLHTLNLDIRSLKLLTVLDLSVNRIDHIDTNMKLELVNITQKIDIKLFGNPFLCDCSADGNILRWFEELLRLESDMVNVVNMEHYNCSNLNQSVYEFIKRDIDKCQLDAKITKFEIPLIAVGAIVGTLALILALSYEFRWRLRWWYYLTKQRLFRQNQSGPIKDNHAYVAHSFNSDFALSWTINTLIPKVEQEWGMRLFVWERDSEAGSPVADNIIKGICNSGVTLILMDPVSCADEWVDFMSHMAMMNKSYLIIKIQNVDLDDVNRVVRQMMKNGCLEWPGCHSFTQSEANLTVRSTCEEDESQMATDNLRTEEEYRETIGSCINAKHGQHQSCSRQEKYFWNLLKGTLSQIRTREAEDVLMPEYTDGIGLLP